MMFTLRVLIVLMALCAVLAISACASSAGTVGVVAVGNLTRNNAHTLSAVVVKVAIPKHSASSGSSTLSSIPSAVVRVLPLNDDRKDLDNEGKSTAAFGVPMGQIRFDPSPATLLGRAIASEFKAAGHQVTDSPDGTQINAAVLEFEAHTDTTLLYWDVLGSLAVSLQFSAPKGANPGPLLAYQARCADRTYTWPSEAVFSGVMNKCINDFASKLRNDGRAADALRHGWTTKAMAESDKPGSAQLKNAARPRVAAEKSYSNPGHAWSVSYPDDWKLNDTNRYVTISKGQAILGIHTLTDVPGESLDEVADATIQQWERQMQNVNTVTRVSRQRVTLADDLTAISIVHHIGAGRVGKSRKIIAIVKDRGFLIDAETHLASWPDYERDFNQIIDSFKVLK